MYTHTMSTGYPTPNPTHQNKGKAFKKMLLERCQEEFEQDQNVLLAELEKMDVEVSRGRRCGCGCGLG